MTEILMCEKFYNQMHPGTNYSSWMQLLRDPHFFFNIVHFICTHKYTDISDINESYRCISFGLCASTGTTYYHVTC